LLFSALSRFIFTASTFGFYCNQQRLFFGRFLPAMIFFPLAPLPFPSASHSLFLRLVPGATERSDPPDLGIFGQLPSCFSPLRPFNHHSYVPPPPPSPWITGIPPEVKIVLFYPHFFGTQAFFLFFSISSFTFYINSSNSSPKD